MRALILLTPLLLAACDNSEPPPTKAEVEVTVKQEQKKPHPPKGERGTVLGDAQRFSRP